MNEIKTSWSKGTSLYGAFDDCISNERILIQPEEFDYLGYQLFEN